jgi:hypothetical protein
MPNLLEDGAAWLAGQLADHAGRSVTFLRGVTESEPVVGTAVQQDYELLVEGMVTVFTLWDWTFATANLPWTLRAGDRLKATLLGSEAQFEVLPIGKRPCSELLDTSGLMTLVHTKRVANG